MYGKQAAQGSSIGGFSALEFCAHEHLGTMRVSILICCLLQALIVHVATLWHSFAASYRSTLQDRFGMSMRGWEDDPPSKREH